MVVASAVACDDTPHGGVFDLPVCEEDVREFGFRRVEVDSDLISHSDETYDLTVTEWTSSAIELLRDPDSIQSDNPGVSGRIATPSLRAGPFPEPGAPVTLQGGTCAEVTVAGYMRITDRAGALLWEGGDMRCNGPEFNRGWDETARLVTALHPEAPVCRMGYSRPECCCETWTERQILLQVGGTEVTLVPWEETEISIDDRSYLAVAQAAYQVDPSPCAVSLSQSYELGSAYIAPRRPPCLDPVCQDGETETRACRCGGEQTRVCVEGCWIEWSRCASIELECESEGERAPCESGCGTATCTDGCWQDCSAPCHCVDRRPAGAVIRCPGDTYLLPGFCDDGGDGIRQCGEASGNCTMSTGCPYER